MAYESHRFCKDGMEYFSSRPGRVFAIRLDRGDLILESIIEFVKKEGIKDAVVVSGIGTLDCCTLHMVMTTGIPVVEHFKKWEDKPLELSSVSGIIADGRPHLHAVVSDHMETWSGHLEEGCRVLYLAELVIIELEQSNLTRIPDEDGIFMLKSKHQN